MAIYKGREVMVVGKTDGSDTAPLYTIQHKDGNRENVRMNQLQFTEEEVKNAKDSSVLHLEGANVIKNDELQKIRDSQNKEKIEKEQAKQSTGPVEVSKVMVDPSEVQDKSTITPQMTKDQRAEKKAK